MDKEQFVLWEHRALAAMRSKGQGKLGLTKFPVFLRNLLPSQFYLCLDLEGKGDGDAVFSVWGKKWRSITWGESLLIPTLFSIMIIPSKSSAPQ